MAAGKASAMVAPVTKLGPALVATMVYVVVRPGVYVATPSVLVICRSATGAGVSVSVAELLPGVGSVVPTGTVTVAVLTRLPTAVELMLATIVKVAVPPTARLTRLLMLPLPLAGPEEPTPA